MIKTCTNIQNTSKNIHTKDQKQDKWRKSLQIETTSRNTRNI